MSQKESFTLTCPLKTVICRRYAEPLLDILIAGGQLAPGGKIESPVRAAVCVFTCEPMVESLKEHVQVLIGKKAASKNHVDF